MVRRGNELVICLDTDYSIRVLQQARNGEAHQSMNADAGLEGKLAERIVLPCVEFARPRFRLKRQIHTRTAATAGFWGHPLGSSREAQLHLAMSPQIEHAGPSDGSSRGANPQN